MIICMILASVVFFIFLVLFLSAGDSLTLAMLTSCRETEIEHRKMQQLEMADIVEHIKRTKDVSDKQQTKRAKKLKKKIDETQKLLEKYSKGKISGIDLIPVAGYRLMQILGWDATNPNVKKLYQKCLQYKEKKEAMNYTYYLFGALIGYVILGIGLFFAALGICFALELGTKSYIVAGAVAGVCFLIGYVPYDNVSATVAKRAEEIELQFPQAVSKMTLLTVAGMEVNQAWKLTSASGKGVLYQEMKRVLIDLDNNVSPTEAYSKFITRCNNKYTTKLATAIIQNISKGNSEIVGLFRSLNDESWLEHKHNARRMGEKIQSKLLIPTLLMFFGIIILIIVPVIGGFSF